MTTFLILIVLVIFLLCILLSLKYGGLLFSFYMLCKKILTGFKFVLLGFKYIKKLYFKIRR
jgi:hypothetical protein